MSVEAGDSSARRLPAHRPDAAQPLQPRPEGEELNREHAPPACCWLATVVAILWANSPWAQSYWTLLDTHVGFSFGDMQFEMTVKHLINDGLMTFFFFVVGLEVMAEFTIGQLTDRATGGGSGARGRSRVSPCPR